MLKPSRLATSPTLVAPSNVLTASRSPETSAFAERRQRSATAIAVLSLMAADPRHPSAAPRSALPSARMARRCAAFQVARMERATTVSTPRRTSRLVSPLHSWEGPIADISFRWRLHCKLSVLYLGVGCTDWKGLLRYPQCRRCPLPGRRVRCQCVQN